MRGVSAKHDPRFHKDEEKIALPENVGESLETNSINVNALENWVMKELAKYTDDDFLSDIVMGFIRGKTLNSQDLAKTIQPTLGDKTGEFVSSLWDLLVDAKSNELGIPSVILEQSRKAIEASAKMREEGENRAVESYSDSYSSSERRRRRRRARHCHHTHSEDGERKRHKVHHHRHSHHSHRY